MRTRPSRHQKISYTVILFPQSYYKSTNNASSNMLSLLASWCDTCHMLTSELHGLCNESNLPLLGEPLHEFLHSVLKFSANRMKFSVEVDISLSVNGKQWSTTIPFHISYHTVFEGSTTVKLRCAYFARQGSSNAGLHKACKAHTSTTVTARTKIAALFLSPIDFFLSCNMVARPTI